MVIEVVAIVAILVVAGSICSVLIHFVIVCGLMRISAMIEVSTIPSH